jgi:hypothetical protein
MSDHVRYLEALLAGYRHRAELHRHQLAAAERYLALARAAASPADYHAATGDLFELTRAEWLDRYFNEACIFRSIDNPRRLAASAICYLAGYRADGHAELYGALTAAKADARQLQVVAEHREGCVAPLVTELLELETAGDPIERQAHAENAVGLAAYFDPAGWGAIAGDPACRRRLPFRDDALAIFEGWMTRATGRPTGAAEPVTGAPSFDDLCARARAYVAAVPIAGAAADEPPIPTIDQALAPYRALRDRLTDGDPAGAAMRAVCQRIVGAADDAEHGGALTRQLAEDGLLVELARAPQLALARQSQARLAGWSQPHAEAHYRTLIEALEAARSTTEIEYEVTWRQDCFAAETAWNEILLAVASRPLRAALAWEFDRSERRRRSIVAAYRTASGLLGLDWDGLLTTPRVAGFVRDVLVTEGQALRTAGDDDDDDSPAPSRGAALGEVGLGITRDIQKIAALAVVGRLSAGELPDPAVPRFADADALAAHATALFRAATAGGDQFARPGSPDRRTLQLWGRPVHIDDLPAVLVDPPRPAIDHPG